MLAIFGMAGGAGKRRRREAELGMTRQARRRLMFARQNASAEVVPEGRRLPLAGVVAGRARSLGAAMLLLMAIAARAGGCHVRALEVALHALQTFVLAAHVELVLLSRACGRLPFDGGVAKLALGSQPTAMKVPVAAAAV